MDLLERLQHALVDRYRPGNQVSAVNFLGEAAPFPTGPWQIAAALKVPVVLCFGLYCGGRRYLIRFELLADAITADRNHRAGGLRPWVERYVERLEHYCRRYPYNWFNFYEQSL